MAKVNGFYTWQYRVYLYREYVTWSFFLLSWLTRKTIDNALQYVRDTRWWNEWNEKMTESDLPIMRSRFSDSQILRFCTKRQSAQNTSLRKTFHFSNWTTSQELKAHKIQQYCNIVRLPYVWRYDAIAVSVVILQSTQTTHKSLRYWDAAEALRARVMRKEKMISKRKTRGGEWHGAKPMTWKLRCEPASRYAMHQLSWILSPHW